MKGDNGEKLLTTHMLLWVKLICRKRDEDATVRYATLYDINGWYVGGKMLCAFVIVCHDFVGLQIDQINKSTAPDRFVQLTTAEW